MKYSPLYRFYIPHQIENIPDLFLLIQSNLKEGQVFYTSFLEVSHGLEHYKFAIYTIKAPPKCFQINHISFWKRFQQKVMNFLRTYKENSWMRHFCMQLVITQMLFHLIFLLDEIHVLLSVQFHLSLQQTIGYSV